MSPENPTVEKRLEAIIEQGEILSRRSAGLFTLRHALQEQIKKFETIDPAWLGPALEVLDDYECDLMEWFEDRIDVAKGAT